MWLIEVFMLRLGRLIAILLAVAYISTVREDWSAIQFQ